MILFINTTDYGVVIFSLLKEGFLKTFSRELKFNENYRTLELLEKFLKKEKIKPIQITKIIVCSGPGSFTGIRVGVSMAQALGFALNIPVLTIPTKKVPQDLSKLLTLKLPDKFLIDYGYQPKITPSKIKTRS